MERLDPDDMRLLLDDVPYRRTALEAQQRMMLARLEELLAGMAASSAGLFWPAHWLARDAGTATGRPRHAPRRAVHHRGVRCHLCRTARSQGSTRRLWEHRARPANAYIPLRRRKSHANGP